MSDSSEKTGALYKFGWAWYMICAMAAVMIYLMVIAPASIEKDNTKMLSNLALMNSLWFCAITGIVVGYLDQIRRQISGGSPGGSGSAKGESPPAS